MRRRTVINETKREDVLLMHKFFTKIQVIHRGKFFSNIVKSLSDAFGLHRKTIQGIINKNDDQDNENSSKNETEIPNCVDSFNADIIRRVVHGFYSEKVLPTLGKIQNRLEQEHGIEIKTYKLRLE